MNLRNSKGKVITLALIIFLFLLAGCTGDKAELSTQGNMIKIGVSLSSMDSGKNQAIKKVMDKRKYRENVQITWMDAKMDASQQEKDVNYLISQGVNVIILQAVNNQEAAQLVERIVQAKIRVIGLETLPANAPLDGYVAPDHKRAGQLQGNLVLNMFNSREQSGDARYNVLVLKGAPGDAVSEEITEGVKAVLQESKFIEGIRVAECYSTEDAQSAIEDAIASGKLDAIVTTDSSLGLASVGLLNNQNLKDKVITVGVGAEKETAIALANGKHDAEIDIRPEHLGNYAFDAALDLVNKGTWSSESKIQNGNFDVPAKITPVRLVQTNQAYLLEERWGTLKQKRVQETIPKEEQSTEDEQEEQPAEQPDTGEQRDNNTGEGTEENTSDENTQTDNPISDGNNPDTQEGPVEQQNPALEQKEKIPIKSTGDTGEQSTPDKSSEEQNSSAETAEQGTGQQGSNTNEESQVKTTWVRIVTQEGKVMEVEVEGELKVIDPPNNQPQQ